MSTWRLVTNQMIKYEKSVFDNAIAKITFALDENAFEAGEGEKLKKSKMKSYMSQTGIFRHRITLLSSVVLLVRLSDVNQFGCQHFKVISVSYTSRLHYV